MIGFDENVLFVYMKTRIEMMSEKNTWLKVNFYSEEMTNYVRYLHYFTF